MKHDVLTPAPCCAHTSRVRLDYPATAGPVTHSPNVFTSHMDLMSNVFTTWFAYPASRSRVSCVGRALPNARLVIALLPSHASLLGLAVCLLSGVQRNFCLV